MKITEKFAQSIVDEIGKITNNNINFMNEEGRIIASKDKARIGTVHEGALQVLKTREEVIVTEGEDLKGAKPGINLPVIFNDKVIGVIGITGCEEEVAPFGKIIKKMTEILVKEAYFEQQSYLVRRAKNMLIDEWLNGDIENVQLFSSRGWMHGINVHLPRISIVLEARNINDIFYNNLKGSQLDVKEEINLQTLRYKILQLIEEYFKFEPQNIVYMSGDSRYVILKTINQETSNAAQKELVRSRVKDIIEKIQNKYSIDMSVGIGRFHPDVKGVIRSYREAKRALEIAKKYNHIIFYEQLGVEAFINEISEETKREIIERIFPFYKDSDEMSKIAETLEMFFHSNQSLDETSNKLFIHKNTLQYRLKRVKEQTGYDPRKFMDAILLYIALMFYFDQEY